MTKLYRYLLILGSALFVMLGSFYYRVIFARLDTVYAPNFSEANFQSIASGMSKGNVKAFIGEPLSTGEYDDGTVIWYYSKQANPRANYWNRLVEFGKENRVVATRKDLYID